MKKLFTFAILFVLAGFVLSSCKSSSVMKRRYNKGYYVHHKGKPTAPKVHESLIASNAAKKPAEAAPASNPSLPAVYANSSLTTPVVTAEARQTKAAVTQTQVHKHKGFLKSIPPEYSIKAPIKTLKNISTKVKAADSPEGDALSLLWIVIVVLLIIYLLGLLFGDFGIGALIHILAVIILVLLILWLLRIL